MHSIRTKALISLMAIAVAALLAMPLTAFAANTGSQAATGTTSLVSADLVTATASSKAPTVQYRTFLGGKGWATWKKNYGISNAIGGKSGLHRIAVKLGKGAPAGSIYYRVNSGNGVWTKWSRNGVSAIVKGNIEAVQIKMTGAVAKSYDVVYRAYINGVGWQRRMCNGETAGSIDEGKNIRALRIRIMPKSIRSGWVGSGKSWSFYRNGKMVKSAWVVTKESPINALVGSAQAAKRYWLNSSGKLAVNRTIDPKNAMDVGARHKAFATSNGYVYTDTVKQIRGTWYAFDKVGTMTKASNKHAALIERYVRWAINIANDNSHGYCQAHRWGPDYDCSSLVIASLSNTGFEVGSAVYTGNMKSELTKHGFKWYTNLKNLKRGDILLVHHDTAGSDWRQHTEIFLGSGKTVGAHGPEGPGVNGVEGDQTKHEIDVGPYYNIGWDGFLRFVG